MSIIILEPETNQSHSNNQTQTDHYRNNQYLDETQDTSSPVCCIARPNTNIDTSPNRQPEKPCQPINTQPTCSNRSERATPQCHYPTNYNYTPPDCGGAAPKQPFQCMNTYDRVESQAQNTANVCFPKSLDDRCACASSPSQKKKRKRSPFSCLRQRDDVAPLTQSQENILQSRNVQPGMSSVDISPERYRPCSGNSAPVRRQLECKPECQSEVTPPEQVCSCDNSDEIPYERNLAQHYEKCTEQPPPFTSRAQAQVQAPRCNCQPLDSRELQSEPSGCQVPSELIQSNYYEQRPARATQSNSQTCNCKNLNESSRDYMPYESCPLPIVTYSPAQSFQNNYNEQSAPSKDYMPCESCPLPIVSYSPAQSRQNNYNEQRSLKDYMPCEPSALPIVTYSPAQSCQNNYNNYNEQKTVFGATSQPPQQRTSPCRYEESLAPSTTMPVMQPSLSYYDDQRSAQPAHPPSHTYSAHKTTNPCVCQVQKCPYCSAMEQQQGQISFAPPTRPCQETSLVPQDMNSHPQDSEGTTPCTYQTTDTETQESSTVSAKPTRTVIGCSYLSDEVFYSLSSESSEQDLTQSGRKNRQSKKHKKPGKSESKARNIVILQLLHEVVHLISDDENTKTQEPPVKRKIRNISAIGNDEADVCAFSSRTNLSSIKITILPGQAQSAAGSRQCTEGSEAAANISQPAQSFEIFRPRSGTQTAPGNLFIAPNLTCSNPNYNSMQETTASPCQQDKYSHGNIDKQSFFNWNPGTETINYAMEELQPNTGISCEPEIIEPDIECICVDTTLRSPCKDRSSDKHQDDDVCTCFEPSVQRPKSLKQKPTGYEECFGSNVQRSKSGKIINSTAYEDVVDCFGAEIQQPKSMQPESPSNCNPEENPADNDYCTCNSAKKSPVTRLKPCHKPRSVNTEYAFSSCGTTSSGEIGDRPRRTNKLQFLTTTPVDVRCETVPKGEEPCDCDCECHEPKKEECPKKKEECPKKKEECPKKIEECPKKIEECPKEKEEECPCNKETNQNDVCCQQNRDDECEIKKEKTREKSDPCCCDCCHCKAMRAKQQCNVCNTIATPEQVLNDGGVTEMKYFIDSIIMDLDAMEASRRSKFGPQRPKQPSICPRQSFPVTIMDVTDLGSSSLYVKWNIHDCYGIGGYEIYVDGHLTNRYFHCNHEAAVICDIDVTEPHKIVLLAQPKIDDNFEDLCIDRNDNKMDLVREKCKSLLKRNDRKDPIPADSNKAINALWTPSIYYYDPVNRKADCPKPKVVTC